ncbi:hypothetical protein P170DRAFT_469962 [Aspergillus steynii IBT 23096]|uniref:Uncharacterized protein n=1 Tax=Aspergillus steynii IBT 23096 TaxID=1392250 RepID=A0A2I2GNN8_9EURO|nr:uncharacterized protein P170DRAFT_469962 [Aspergillus steynii IBT 23096]PLB54501.1 hypothetical protein P170DRAFT_469962 [Aspergillus steynii IBT 23096]
MQLSTIFLLASSAIIPLVAGQECYSIQRYGRRDDCRRCDRGYRFYRERGRRCHPDRQCCRGYCCTDRDWDYGDPVSAIGSPDPEQPDRQWEMQASLF